MANELKYALELADGFSGPADDARDSAKSLKNEVEDTSGAAKRGSSGLGGFITKAKGLATVAAAGAAAVGIFAAAFTGLKAASTAAAEMEQTQVAFRTLIGDAEKTETTLKRLQQLGASTPFEFASDLAPAARSLIAFGEAAENVPAALSRIGDVASGVTAPIGEIAEIYGKARVQGQLFSEDINQLTGRGIPVIGQFAKILGVSQAEVKKLASEGKITFPILDQAFRNLTAEGGQFFEMMKQQSQTTNGMISTLKDNITQLLIEIGTPVNDNVIKPMLQEALGITQRIGAGITAVIGIAKASIANGSIGSLLSTALKIGLQEGVNYGAGAFSTLGQLLSGQFNFAFERLQRIFSPQTWGQIGEVVAGAFVTVFIGLPQILAGLAQMAQAEFGGAFGTIVTNFQAGLEFAIQKVMEMMGKIPGVNEFLGLDGFKADSFDDIRDRYQERNDPSNLKTEAQATIKSGMDAIADGLKLSTNGLKDLALDYVDDVTKSFGDVKFEPAQIFDTGSLKSELADLAKNADPEAFQKLMDAISGTAAATQVIDNQANSAADGLKNALAAAKAVSDENKKNARGGSERNGEKEREEFADKGRKKIKLYGLQDSAIRRLGRMSDADKAKNFVPGMDSKLMLNAAKALEAGKGLKSAGEAKKQQDESRRVTENKARWDSVLKIEEMFGTLAVG